MAAADGASAGRKPWRYYYVMAFPLGGCSSIAPDKARVPEAESLQEMTEMTAAIEQREERYLRKVAAKNAALAAAAEAERRVANRKETPTMASHVAWVLRRLYAVSVALLLLVVVVAYALYLKDDGRECTPLRLGYAVAVSAVLLLVVNLGGWMAAYRRSVNGTRAIFVVNIALIIALALILDELVIVRRSHIKLREVLAKSEDALAQDTLDLVLNGGTVPSLVQRFVFDAPSVFLQWLRLHCSGSQTMIEYVFVAIDRREFFAPFWNDRDKSCVDATLKSCVQLEEVLQPILIGVLVLISLQVLLTGVFLIILDPPEPEKPSKRRRQFFLPKAKTFSLPDLPAVLKRLLILGAALFGSWNAVVSTDLLHLCSIADFQTLFTWIIMMSLVSGISAMIAALFIGCGWKQQLAGALLAVAVALEGFTLAELIQLAARFAGVAENNQVHVQELRELYIKVSVQTCAPITHWISHVCVSMASNDDPAEFNRSCQQEFMALLIVSFNWAKSYLTWSIGVKLMLLVQLVFPILRQAAENTVMYLCCFSSRNEPIVKTVENLIQHSSSPLDYEEAIEMYLSSMRVKDPARLAMERDAFEKEWSIRTGRSALPDIRTSRVRVVISANDFGAIVRTLLLRRLTTVCKLDVSLSVSNDGQLLLVRLFASDNLLLATLCENETYRLQFADAIDPGRSFWLRDTKEVKTDEKILDANTVKHKLKLLTAENAMPMKEAVWFPGESLARVSARVHALSRLLRASRGLIHCHNPAPAFVSYSPNIQRQFIYKRYPHKLDIPGTSRRSAVLRTVDCIRVTRHIVNTEFDTTVMVASGLITSFHCLHSSSRFDWNDRKALASSWVTFWRPVHLQGEFGPEEHPILNLFGRIATFRQPLQDVRDYFGELIGFYFAWLAFYAKMLVVPVLLAITVIVLASETKPSLVTLLWVYYTSPHDLDADNAKMSDDFDKNNAIIPVSELVLGLLVIVWSFIVMKLWERRSVWYQLQWGVTTGDKFPFDNYTHGINDKHSLCSELTSIQRQLWSWLSIFALASINLLAVLTMLLSQGLLVDICGEKLAIIGSCLCQALLMHWNGAWLPILAHSLSKWEKPSSSSDHPSYQSAVIVKLFTLQMLNTFTGLILLMLSSVDGLTLLVHLVAPLEPLYVSYTARVEGHVGIFIQMETLLFAIFITQLCLRVLLILPALKRFRVIQQGEQRYSKGEYEDETRLSSYPGPHKDYAQLIVQLGLVVMFSGVCPLLPLLAFIDCAVRLRQNALELCCIRQRPEPNGVQSLGSVDDDVGLRLWAPCTLFMLQFSVPVALSLVFFVADNLDDLSIERRTGYWLLGVLSIWGVAQLLSVVLPRQSRLVEETQARNAFLIDRFFGHAQVHDQKLQAKDTSSKCVEMEDFQEPAPSVEQALQHYEERLELLHRLNVALRKRQDMGGAVSFASVKMAVTTPSDQDDDVQAEETMEGVQSDEEKYSIDGQNGGEAASFFTEDEARHQESENSDERIVAQLEEIVDDKAPPIEIVEPIEEPLGTLSVEEINIGENSERGQGGGNAATTGRPAPMRLSKLFKRMPLSLATLVSTTPDEADTTLLPPSSSPFVSVDSSFPLVDNDPRIFAPTEAVQDAIASHEDELLEEKNETPPPFAEQEADVSLAAPTADTNVASSRRRFSAQLSFQPSKSKSSTSEDGGNNNKSQAEAGDRTLLRQLSPRLSFSFRQIKRSSSKASDSEENTSDRSVVPEPPVPRQRSTSPPPESPLIATNLSPFERPEAENRAVNPTTSRRDEFDFLSAAHAESTTQGRKSSGRRHARLPPPPPVYTKMDLSGLEAVHEAASRRQFDFSADEQVWGE